MGIYDYVTRRDQQSERPGRRGPRVERVWESLDMDIINEPCWIDPKKRTGDSTCSTARSVLSCPAYFQIPAIKQLRTIDRFFVNFPGKKKWKEWRTMFTWLKIAWQRTSSNRSRFAFFFYRRIITHFSKKNKPGRFEMRSWKTHCKEPTGPSLMCFSLSALSSLGAVPIW